MVSKKTLASTGQALLELWHRLFGRQVKQHEAAVYGRAVESGGVILTIRVLESEAARAMGILNAHNVVDVHERAAQVGLTSATSFPKLPRGLSCDRRPWRLAWVGTRCSA